MKEPVTQYIYIHKTSYRTCRYWRSVHTWKTQALFDNGQKYMIYAKLYAKHPI